MQRCANRKTCSTRRNSPHPQSNTLGLSDGTAERQHGQAAVLQLFQLHFLAKGRILATAGVSGQGMAGGDSDVLDNVQLSGLLMTRSVLMFYFNCNIVTTLTGHAWVLFTHPYPAPPNASICRCRLKAISTSPPCALTLASSCGRKLAPRR